MHKDTWDTGGGTGSHDEQGTRRAEDTWDAQGASDARNEQDETLQAGWVRCSGCLGWGTQGRVPVVHRTPGLQWGTGGGRAAWGTRDGREAGGARDVREVPGRCPVRGCPARPRASVARAVAVPLTFTNQLSPSAHPLPSLAVLSPWRLRNLCSLVNGISAKETPTPPSLPLPAPGEILASHLHPHPLLPLGIKGTSPC